MTYKKYTIMAFAILMTGFAANANDTSLPNLELDVQSIEFIEEDHNWELGFDTSKYLPEGFDPYQGEFSVSSLNFMDLCDEIELGFETVEYLPSDFNPYSE